MSAEPLPCPFCGNATPALAIESHHDGTLHSAIITCLNVFSCGASLCQTLMNEQAAKENAIHSWNQRTTPSVSVDPESKSANIDEITKDIADCVSMTLGGIDLPRVKRILRKALEEQEPQPESGAEVPQMDRDYISILITSLDSLFRLPNWQNRCGKWSDVNDALANIELAYSWLKPAPSVLEQPKSASASGVSPNDSRRCYLCGFRADQHNWIPDKGGWKRGPCPSNLTTNFTPRRSSFGAAQAPTLGKTGDAT